MRRVAWRAAQCLPARGNDTDLLGALRCYRPRGIAAANARGRVRRKAERAVHRLRRGEELYNLVRDPDEETNLIGSLSHRALLPALQEQLERIESQASSKRVN